MEGVGFDSVYDHPDLTNVSEFIKDKLYFATIRSGKKGARSTKDIHCFTVDNELVYANFYHDFGPLNIACLYRYCCKIKKKLKNAAYRPYKRIVHYTSRNEEKRANAAYLITSYAVLYLNKSPNTAYKMFIAGGIELPLKPFRDASMIPSPYNIDLLDCLNAVCKAASFGFFNFDDFNLAEYEMYEQMRNGALSWSVPQKFLAFVGPSTEPGTIYHPPEYYVDYFVNNGVVAVIRLNKKAYDASAFTKAGITHHDMFMPDGSVPPQSVLRQFLSLAENTNGPIAVHCKAGLGRTGSLIAAYLIKHYAMTAREAIAWVRICRPGSVIGSQQDWLERMENKLLNAGREFRLKYYDDDDTMLCHEKGIYSEAANKLEGETYGGRHSFDNNCNRYNETNKVDVAHILGNQRNVANITNISTNEFDPRQRKANADGCERMKRNKPFVKKKKKNSRQ